MNTSVEQVRLVIIDAFAEYRQETGRETIDAKSLPTFTNHFLNHWKEQQGGLRWVRCVDQLPKEHKFVIFQWEDTKASFYNKPFNLRDENGNIGGLTRLKWLDESAPPNNQQGCGICGGTLVSIRGKYPQDEKRLVCPTCNTERLDQINEISSKTYGVAYQANTLSPSLNHQSKQPWKNNYSK